jgi:hypothetical protein
MSFDVRQYMADKLLSQFRESVHVNELLDVLASAKQDPVDVCEFILSSTDIHTATGDILNIYGEMIGVKRPPAQETKLFQLTSSVDPPDDYENNHGFYDSNDGTGGYMSSIIGLPAIDGSELSDDDYRDLILAKAATFRTRATREEFFSYLLQFGARCILDDDTKFSVEIEQVTWSDFNDWQRNYVLTKGFDPAGINVAFKDNLTKEVL